MNIKLTVCQVHLPLNTSIKCCLKKKGESMGNDQKKASALTWVYQAVQMRIDFCKKTMQMSATAEV